MLIRLLCIGFVSLLMYSEPVSWSVWLGTLVMPFTSRWLNVGKSNQQKGMWLSSLVFLLGAWFSLCYGLMIHKSELYIQLIFVTLLLLNLWSVYTIDIQYFKEKKLFYLTCSIFSLFISPVLVLAYLGFVIAWASPEKSFSKAFLKLSVLIVLYFFFLHLSHYKVMMLISWMGFLPLFGGFLVGVIMPNKEKVME